MRIESLLVALLAPFAEAFCLRDVPPTQLKTFEVDGRVLPLTIGYGSGSSSAIAGTVLATILEEVLEVEVRMVAAVSSTQLLKRVIGCTDANGQEWNYSTHPLEAQCNDRTLFQTTPSVWLGVGVWMATAEEIRLSQYVNYRAPLGYQVTNGIFTQASTIRAGEANGTLLQWWQSLLLKQEAHRYFTSIQDLDQAIRDLPVAFTKSSLCADGDCGPGKIQPLCDESLSASAPWLRQLANLSQKCDGGWWYAEGCRTQRELCIPLVWSEPESGIVDFIQVVQNLGMPLAITWVGWFGAQEVIQQLTSDRFLFNWWTPDHTFVRLPDGAPQQVVFNNRDMFKQVFPELVTWEGLDALRPDIARLLRAFELPGADLQVMVERKAAGQADRDNACEWLMDPAQKNFLETWFAEDKDTDSTIMSTQAPDKPLPPWQQASLELWQMLMIMGAVFACLATVPFCLWRVMKCSRKHHDSPAAAKTETGKWVTKFIGCGMQERLEEKGSSSRRSRRWLVNGTPFELRLSVSDMRQDTVTMKPHTYMRIKKRRTDKTPHIAVAFGNQQHVSSIFVRAIPEKYWKMRPLEFNPDDFHTQPSAREEGHSSRHVNFLCPVARKPINTGCPEQPTLGCLKAVLGPNNSLLLVWSPPHVLRGVPIEDLEHFLEKVITDPGKWEGCCDIDPATCERVRDKLVTKGKREGSSRNMYDAVKHIVKPQASVVDASYAEVFTDYGPPTIFISHVWAETAARTQNSLKKLTDWLARTMSRTGQLDDITASSIMPVMNDTSSARSERGIRPSNRSSRGADIGRIGFSYRVYFCVLCNNQSRVREELGDDIMKSPFATVMTTQVCRQVAVISPFLALSRLWCNYEFCLARKHRKPVWLATHEGVIQAGQVAPSVLKNYAKKIRDFKCKDAKYSSEDDREFISAAVEQLGGYDKQDQILRQIFRQAIGLGLDELRHAMADLPVDREEFDDMDPSEQYMAVQFGDATTDCLRSQYGNAHYMKSRSGAASIRTVGPGSSTFGQASRSRTGSLIEALSPQMSPLHPRISVPRASLQAAHGATEEPSSTMTLNTSGTMTLKTSSSASFDPTANYSRGSTSSSVEGRGMVPRGSTSSTISIEGRGMVPRGSTSSTVSIEVQEQQPVRELSAEQLRLAMAKRRKGGSMDSILVQVVEDAEAERSSREGKEVTDGLDHSGRGMSRGSLTHHRRASGGNQHVDFRPQISVVPLHEDEECYTL